MVLGHVKWFSDFDFGDAPRTVGEVVTPTFVALAVASVVAMAALVLVDRRLDAWGPYGRVNAWLTERREHAPTILRLAMAATLIISWENRALLTPELAERVAWVGWAQLVLAVLLLVPSATRVAGLGVVGLWVAGAVLHNPFHMLDYLHYVGIGIYLAVEQDPDPRRRELGLPALYATVGFSLIWLGFEKLVYPAWSLKVIEDNPGILLGLDPEFFLQGAAFVEIVLGFLLLIGLLERPLAALITVVFITTTFVFGRVEVVGHTPLHAALVVFLLQGPGHVYRPPIHWHSRIPLRVAFASVNFVLALVVFSFAYTTAARIQQQDEAERPQASAVAPAPPRAA